MKATATAHRPRSSGTLDNMRKVKETDSGRTKRKHATTAAGGERRGRLRSRSPQKRSELSRSQGQQQRCRRRRRQRRRRRRRRRWRSGSNVCVGRVTKCGGGGDGRGRPRPAGEAAKNQPDDRAPSPSHSPIPSSPLLSSLLKK